HPSCGYETVTVGYDDDGNAITETRMRSCLHDEARHETRHCSDEVMNYEANYERPDLNVWGPGTSADDRGIDPLKRYHDIIPNKYDLLPGETESIQIYNTSGNFSLFDSGSTSLEPYVEFGDPWNK